MLVPEERVVGGSGGLSLLGRERGQEAFEFLGEEPGRGSALGELPEIQVFEDVFDDTRLFDHRDHLESVTALGTRQFPSGQKRVGGRFWTTAGKNLISS